MAASGDPQTVAAPVFVIGSIALGIQLTDAISPIQGSLGSPIAILLGCTGLFLLLSTWWAASAGQSFVACFAGTFGGFWIGYSLLVLGVLHNWFIIPPAAIANTVVMFSLHVRDLLRVPDTRKLAFADHLHLDLRAGRARVVPRGCGLLDDARQHQYAEGRRLCRVCLRRPRDVAVLDGDEPVTGRAGLPAVGTAGHQAPGKLTRTPPAGEPETRAPRQLLSGASGPEQWSRQTT